MQILRALSLALLALAPLPATAQTEAAASLRLALNESGRGNWQAALQQARSSSAVGQDIIQWQRLRAGTGTLTEYEDFLARRPDWPGMPLLHERAKRPSPAPAIRAAFWPISARACHRPAQAALR